MTVSITKADGTVEIFDTGKLTASLKHAGASGEAALDITNEIAREIKDGATTHEIYRRAFALLRGHRRTAAARYSLKKAVLEFGPSGFPFEAYLAELFRTEGYDASVDRHIRGRCVEHEVDVVLARGSERVYVEAKFHNTPGFKTDLQVALYVQARLEDIEAQVRAEHSSSQSTPLSLRGMLVTNTKFTSLATQYAECQKLELMGWDYPSGRSLNELIDVKKLYPITALTTLSRGEKTALLSQRVVLCRDLARHEAALTHAGVHGNRMSEVLMEAGGLCDM